MCCPVTSLTESPHFLLRDLLCYIHKRIFGYFQSVFLSGKRSSYHTLLTFPWYNLVNLWAGAFFTVLERWGEVVQTMDSKWIHVVFSFWTGVIALHKIGNEEAVVACIYVIQYFEGELCTLILFLFNCFLFHDKFYLY